MSQSWHESRHPLRGWLLSLATGKYDDAYKDKRYKIGVREDTLLNLSDADEAILREIVAQQKENINMANLNQTLEAVMAINGAFAAALVDWESGLTLGTIGSGMDIDLAAAGNTNVVRSKLAVMKDLNLKGSIEDILITLTEQYHMIRILESNPNLFLYVALRRNAANLGLARHRLSSIEKNLEL